MRLHQVRVLLFLLLFSMLLPANAALAPSAGEQRLFDLLNQERARAGLPQLKWDGHLAEAARAHSKLLASHAELSHQFPGEPDLGQRVGATGLRFNSTAENVAYAPEVEKLHEGLMHSPPHRANILSNKYNAGAVAIVARGEELYATEDFANALPVYSESEFRSAIVSAFNKTRAAAHLPLMVVRADDRLHRAACSGAHDPNQLIHRLPGVTDLVMFTSSVPENLPSNMKSAAQDKELRHMNIGVCFRPGSANGYGSFWVVAAFFPVQ